MVPGRRLAFAQPFANRPELLPKAENCAPRGICGGAPKSAAWEQARSARYFGEVNVSLSSCGRQFAFD